MCQTVQLRRWGCCDRIADINCQGDAVGVADDRVPHSTGNEDGVAGSEIVSRPTLGRAKGRIMLRLQRAVHRAHIFWPISFTRHEDGAISAQADQQSMFFVVVRASRRRAH